MKKHKVPEGLTLAPDPKEDARNHVMRDLFHPLVSDERSIQNFERRFWRGGYDIDNDGNWHVIYLDKPESYKNGTTHVAAVLSRLKFYQELPDGGCKLSGWQTNWMRQATDLTFFDAEGKPLSVEITISDETEDDLAVGYILPPEGRTLGHAEMRFTIVATEVPFESGKESGVEVNFTFKGGDFGQARNTADTASAGGS